MANEMHRQFIDHCGPFSDYRWDPETMHVFCFCHKLALVVGAGLEALGLKTPPPRKLKTAFRGHFPEVCTTLAEEEEPHDGDSPLLEVPDVPTAPSEDVGSDLEHDLQDIDIDEDGADDLIARLASTGSEVTVQDEADWDAADIEDKTNPMLKLDDTVAPTHRREANKLHYILEKVRLVFLFYPFIVLFFCPLYSFPYGSTHTARFCYTPDHSIFFLAE